ncbi:MAG TPA: hypothetical protein VFB58_03975 [Chloroflexota bacterium]|nr:hypothetical protein [Chloroflexota bacterium]
MLFYVRGEYIDPGALIPPDKALEVIEQAVVPSFQMLAQNGQVKGGIIAGERAGAFVIEADSPEALDSLMNHLPFFGLVRWEVRALVPFATIAQQLPGYINDGRQQMQQAQK